MSKSTAARESWVARARAVKIEAEIARRKIHLHGRGDDRCGVCPRCDGTDRFSINTKKQVWNCRQCKSKEDKGDVIGLVQWLDNCSFDHACEKLTGEPPPKANDENSKDRVAEPRRVVAEEYSYVDDSGAVAFVVERIEFQNSDGTFVHTKEGKREKTFRQKRPNPDQPGSWIRNTVGVPLVPYKLPQLIEARAKGQKIVIVEGERKVDLLLTWNVPSTCCAGGANKWKPEHSAYLVGAHVVMLSDNDAPGRAHRDSVLASLQGRAASISVIDLPGLSSKGDVVDWANAGGTAEQLQNLIEHQAKPWMANHQEVDEPRAPEHSDDALAILFADRHADDLRFVAFRAQWLFWERYRWAPDKTLRAFDCARAICRAEAANCENGRQASALTSAKTIAAVERLAKADRRLAATTEQWDGDAEIFNTPTAEDTP